MLRFYDTDIPTNQNRKVAKCPLGFEAIGQAYNYGYKEGCLCNGKFGGVENKNSRFPKISLG